MWFMGHFWDQFLMEIATGMATECMNQALLRENLPFSSEPSKPHVNSKDHQQIMKRLVSTLQSAVSRRSQRAFRGLAHEHTGVNHARNYSSSTVQEKRILGAIAHINSGKTTTSEAMLYAAGALRRMGNVDVGDTALDFLPAERERGITINAAAICFDWKNHEIFLVDSPGHLDFTYEVERALKVMDGVIVLLDAVAGVQPQTETVWRQADSNALARIVFVNKMDREGADFQKTVASVKQYFASIPVVVQVPIFEQESKKFCGVYDLLQRFEDLSAACPLVNEGTSHHNVSFDELSASQQAYVQDSVEVLVETVAELNDDIMALWLDGAPISRDVMLNALRQACIEGTLVPVLCGSSLRGIGVESLMDSVIKYLPSPLERSPVKALSKDGREITVSTSGRSPFLAYAFKVTHDRHRGRMVHLRAFAGQLEEFRRPFLNTTKGKKEVPTKLLRVLADKFVEIDGITTGDIFAAVGLKHTETGDTLVLQQAPQSSHVVMSGVVTPPAVFSVALEVDLSSQEKELEESLLRLIQEDSSLETTVDEETGETLLSGMGELHLEVAVDHMSRSLGFPIRLSRPRVAYRETVTGNTERLEVYDTTIGSNRFQEALKVQIGPHPSTSRPYDNEISILEDAFSAEEQMAIRDGAEAALGRGPLLGSPVTNAKVSIFPVSEADIETRNDLAALRACASRAVQSALKRSQPKILEPVMQLDCVVPNTTTGDIISEISHPTRRRGTVEAVDVAFDGGEHAESKMSSVRAIVPLEGMIGWATRMRSITKGRGDFTTRFDSYRQVDSMTQNRLITGAVET